MMATETKKITKEASWIRILNLQLNACVDLVLTYRDGGEESISVPIHAFKDALRNAGFIKYPTPLEQLQNQVGDGF